MERLVAVVAPFAFERLAQQEFFESQLVVPMEQRQESEESEKSEGFEGFEGSVVFAVFEESAV